MGSLWRAWSSLTPGSSQREAMRQESLSVAGVLLAVLCCALPLLLLGGVSVVAGALWGPLAIVALGLILALVAFARAAALVRKRGGRGSGSGRHDEG